MTSADVEQWFQTHQEGPFEFRVGSQKHKRDFKGKRSMCLTRRIYRANCHAAPKCPYSTFMLGCKSNEGTFHVVQAAGLSARGRGKK